MERTRASGVPRLGAWEERGRIHFRCWAPEHRALGWVIDGPGREPLQRIVPLEPEPGGYFHASTEGDRASFRYKVRIDGQGPFPDPWSRSQPLGVHGPSALDPGGFRWTDEGWRGCALESLVVYELHVGTATPEGTFAALIPRLPSLVEEGITAIELMPIASFAGRWNWGYDGVSWYAPAQVYGGPSGLRALVDAAHRVGLAVILDVVYNHFGPDGNYLAAYSKSYFTSHVNTPWGDAINYAEEGSPVMRELALRNAEMWIRDYHLDGLRLDATHEIHDDSRPHLVQELASRARAAAPARQVLVVAEDNRNDARIITPVERGGLGLDALWADDLHHELRRAFAGDSQGYFRDYQGTVEEIVETLNEGWFFRGQPTGTAGKPRGSRAVELPPARFLHCIQNHDQIGNRPFGNRLGDDVSPAAYRAMSALLLFSPYTPLLFAGQEWNTRTPFLYFTDHEPTLGRRVTEGRRREFAAFSQFGQLEVPDPQAEASFTRSQLHWDEAERPAAAGTVTLYRELLALRRTHPGLREPSRGSYRARRVGATAFVLERDADGERLELYVNLRGRFEQRLPGATLWMDSEDVRFGGAGAALGTSPLAFEGPRAVLVRQTR